MAFRIGELDERVTIRKRTQTQNEYGELIETTNNLGPYWAGARPQTGSEREVNGTVESQAPYMFILRYEVFIEAAPTTDDTIVWQGVEYNIRFPKDNGPRSQYIMIEAERGVRDV